MSDANVSKYEMKVLDGTVQRIKGLSEETQQIGFAKPIKSQDDNATNSANIVYKTLVYASTASSLPSSFTGGTYYCCLVVFAY